MDDLDRLKIVAVETCRTCDGAGFVEDHEQPDRPLLLCPEPGCVLGQKQHTLSLGEVAALIRAAEKRQAVTA